MKHMKKIFALMIAAVMIMAMGVTTFAATTYTITAPTGSTHTYEVYQIFYGDLDEASGVISNAKWGKNGTGTENADVEKTVMDALETIAKNAEATEAQKLAVIKNYINLNVAAYGEAKDGSPLTVPAGYYLIKDKEGTVSGLDAYTTYIVKVAGAVNIVPKYDVPSSQKKVKDINDSLETEESGWQDSADFDIGDEIHYKISATLPAKENEFAAYKTYFLNFVDDMSAGLTYKANSAVVKVNNVQVATLEPDVVTGQNKVASDATKGTYTSAYAGGAVYKWSIADVKATPYSAKAGDIVSIEYTCTLNNSAVIGSAGNPNKMHIEFDNNPNSEGTGEFGETPDDINIVFTYTVDVDKIDQDFAALDGAGFTLYKLDADTGEYVVVGSEVTGVTNFAWKGIDDGKYKIVETTVPSTYNKVPDVTFTVTATHDVEADNPALKKFVVEDNNDLTASLTAGTVSKKDGSSKPTVSGEIYGEIINQKGASLPETGGVGTTMFYVIGAILVIGAGVVLVTRRRMSS